MKKLFILLLLLVFTLSCSDDNDDNTVTIFPSVTYKVDGFGTAAEIVVKINAFGDQTDPRSSSSQTFENAILPFTFNIPEYYPHQMEIQVSMTGGINGHEVSKISLLKNNVIISSEENMDPEFFIWDTYAHYRLHEEWGVFLN